MMGNATAAVVHTTTVTDQYGDATKTTTVTALTGCAFDPGHSFQTGGNGREGANPYVPAVTVSPTLYVTQAVTVDADDMVTVNGRSYAVDGEPRTWVSPFTGRNHGTVITLRRWDQP